MKDREAAIEWACDVVRRGNVVYLDTETTGLGDDDEIIDIAVIDGDGDVLLDTLVRPRCPISPGATAVHGIDQAMVAHAPEWPEVYPRLDAVLSRYPSVIVYNAAFDRRMIAQVCRAHGLAMPRAEWHCAMLKYAAFVGEIHPRYGGYRWHRLEQAAKAVGASMPPSHRALADARACRAVVHQLAALNGGQSPKRTWVLPAPVGIPSPAPALRGATRVEPAAPRAERPQASQVDDRQVASDPITIQASPERRSSAATNVAIVVVVLAVLALCSLLAVCVLLASAL